MIFLIALLISMNDQIHDLLLFTNSSQFSSVPGVRFNFSLHHFNIILGLISVPVIVDLTGLPADLNSLHIPLNDIFSHRFRVKG